MPPHSSWSEHFNPLKSTLKEGGGLVVSKIEQKGDPNFKKIWEHCSLPCPVFYPHALFPSPPLSIIPNTQPISPWTPWLCVPEKPRHEKGPVLHELPKPGGLLSWAARDVISPFSNVTGMVILQGLCCTYWPNSLNVCMYVCMFVCMYVSYYSL